MLQVLNVHEKYLESVQNSFINASDANKKLLKQ